MQGPKAAAPVLLKQPTQEPSATMKLNLGQLQEQFEHLQEKGSMGVEQSNIT
jgi:hypothetical protein